MATSMSPASDVIIDASMPNLIRVGGQMWNMDDKLKNCQKKAEEYGNHNKTFEIVSEGTITVTNADGNKIFEHAMQAGVIWRMCQVKSRTFPSRTGSSLPCAAPRPPVPRPCSGRTPPGPMTPT